MGKKKRRFEIKKRNKSREQYREMRVLHIQGFYVERGGKKKGFGINALQKKKTKTFLHSKPLVSKKKGEYSVRKKKAEIQFSK